MPKLLSCDEGCTPQDAHRVHARVPPCEQGERSVSCLWQPTPNLISALSYQAASAVTFDSRWPSSSNLPVSPLPSGTQRPSLVLRSVSKLGPSSVARDEKLTSSNDFHSSLPFSSKLSCARP